MVFVGQLDQWNLVSPQVIFFWYFAEEESGIQKWEQATKI
jgi:hypothetical protein